MITTTGNQRQHVTSTRTTITTSQVAHLSSDQEMHGSAHGNESGRGNDRGNSNQESNQEHRSSGRRGESSDRRRESRRESTGESEQREAGSGQSVVPGHLKLNFKLVESDAEDDDEEGLEGDQEEGHDKPGHSHKSRAHRVSKQTISAHSLASQRSGGKHAKGERHAVRDSNIISSNNGVINSVRHHKRGAKPVGKSQFAGAQFGMDQSDAASNGSSNSGHDHNGSHNGTSHIGRKRLKSGSDSGSGSSSYGGIQKKQRVHTTANIKISGGAGHGLSKEVAKEERLGGEGRRNSIFGGHGGQLFGAQGSKLKLTVLSITLKF